MPEIPDNFEETPDELEPDVRKIRHLNDQLRRTFSGGQVLVTPGIQNLPPETFSKAFQAVRGFEAFTEDNDPYGTHEFGMFELDGHRIMWKIDAYDENLEN